jgi:hypothetical protein
MQGWPSFRNCTGAPQSMTLANNDVIVGADGIFFEAFDLSFRRTNTAHSFGYKVDDRVALETSRATDLRNARARERTAQSRRSCPSSPCQLLTRSGLDHCSLLPRPCNSPTGERDQLVLAETDHTDPTNTDKLGKQLGPHVQPRAALRDRPRANGAGTTHPYDPSQDQPNGA